MPEPTKRIIVDGVEYRRILLFPRIIAAAATAMQPSRLIIALLMVVALITVGRIWDAATDANVHPNGLTSGRWYTYTDGDLHWRTLHNALGQFAPERQPPGANPGDWPAADMDTGSVIRVVKEGYRQQRAALDGDLAGQRRESIDQAFQATMRGIDATRPLGDFEATIRQVNASFGRMVDGVFALNFAQAYGGAKDLFVGTPKLLWEHQKWFAIVFGLFALLILALGGGAIARIAAVQAATNDRLRAREGFDFAFGRWLSLCAAVLLPLLLVLILCVLLAVVGLLLYVPVLDVLVGLAYGLGLLVGLLIAFLLVGYALGFPLLVPAVACEGSDAADAMQRCYAYVVSRPLHLIGYLIVGVVGLAIGFLFVSLLAALTLEVTASVMGYFVDHAALEVADSGAMGGLEREAPPVVAGPWYVRWTAAGMVFWQTVVICLVSAYVISYFFSASTIIYLLMRRLVDGQETTEVWRPGLVPGTLVPEMPPVREPERSETVAPESG